MHRLFVLSLLLAACSSDDGGDDPAPPDDMSPNGATDMPMNPSDGPAAEPDDAGDNTPADAGDGLADVGPDPDMAQPDAAPMVAIGLNVGERAPDFTLPGADGADVSITDFRGGYAVVVGTSMW